MVLCVEDPRSHPRRSCHLCASANPLFSFAGSLLLGFAFQILCGSACARSPGVPGTCDLTDGRSNVAKGAIVSPANETPSRDAWRCLRSVRSSGSQCQNKRYYSIALNRPFFWSSIIRTFFALPDGGLLP